MAAEPRTSAHAYPDRPPSPVPRPPRAILLDLAGDTERARAWLDTRMPGADVLILDKPALKMGSKREMLGRLRAAGPHDLFAIFCNRLELQPSRALMLMFGWLAGARRVVIADTMGQKIERDAAGIALIEGPRLILKMAIGYGVIVPLAWVATWVLAILSRMRGEPRPVPRDEPLDVLYLRATSATGAALIGGSTAHVAGVVEGLAGLGHNVRFIANDRLLEVDHDRMPVAIVPFSPRFGSVRALFEVWNTLVFTAGALGHARARPPDLIYQRYNRFNWTGVALSTILKRPLCLEVNGLEVWVANNWDPVGQVRLLGAIERLNLRAADRVVVVSSVLARDCERSGADAGRIVVNPNGVDPERFRPGVGGERLRRGLGLEGSVVAGFVGTFGPWHGVVTLAEAITRLPREVDVTFLLVGDGDQRSRVERILEDGGARDRVIFTGLVSHGEVAAHLDACDILLSPHVEMPDGSSFFGSPTKLFEYMAMRRPIVASRLGQIGDIVEDEVSGLLITPGAVDELNAAVTRLARDPALRDRLGRAARERVIADYTWRRNAERVVDAVRSKPG